MIKQHIGVQSIGIQCPMFKEGDNLPEMVVDAVLKATAVYDNGYDFSNDKPFYYDIDDKDIIGITESVVARTSGTYLKIDDLVKEIKTLCHTGNIVLMSPIYSRNRFSMILRAFARAANNLVIIMPDFDEVGNPKGLNPNTGVNIEEYYKQICEEENCTCRIFKHITDAFYTETINSYHYVDCSLRPVPIEGVIESKYVFNLKSFGTKVNPTYGLLGSNKANEDTLKLFPTVQDSMRVCTSIQRLIKDKTGKHVEVMVYGDGCFKDNVSGIWEFADPDVSTFYTEGLNGSPNEIKTKYFIDGKYADLKGEELDNAIKEEIKNKKTNLVGNMDSQGTTPRRYVSLLASLMDLTSGSGDRCTPVVLVKNYL